MMEKWLLSQTRTHRFEHTLCNL